MDRIFECMWWTLWIYVGILSLVCIICVFRYMSSSLEVRQGGSVIYWIMILTYKYGFVVLLCIRSFVTYSWLCNMNVRSWMKMKVSIYMDSSSSSSNEFIWISTYVIMCLGMKWVLEYMDDRVKWWCTMVNVNVNVILGCAQPYLPKKILLPKGHCT